MFPPFLLGRVAQIKHFDWFKVVVFWAYSTAMMCSTRVVEMLSRNKENYPTVFDFLFCFPNVIYLLTFTLIKGLQTPYMTRPFILKTTK